MLRSLGLVLLGLLAVSAQPSLPTLPPAFSMTVEMNMLDSNYTTVLHEYVDRDAGLARVDTHVDGRMTSVILDYAANMQYKVVDEDNDNFMSPTYSAGDDSCVQGALNETGYHYFTDPKSGMMKSVAELFNIYDGETYKGKVDVRGVQTDMWKTENQWSWDLDPYGNNITVKSTYQHYFASPGWSLLSDMRLDENSQTGAQHSMPVQIYRWTKTYNISAAGVQNSPPQVRRFMYSIVGFWSGKPDRSLFTTGELLCQGPISAAAAVPLPSLPQQARTVVEANIMEKSYTTYVEETFDFPNSRAKFLTRRKNDAGGYDRITEMDYYDTGMQIQLINESTCVANGIADSKRSAGNRFLDKNSGHSRMMSTAQVFHFGAEFNETYAGQARARGIPCDKWVVQVTDTATRPDMSVDPSTATGAPTMRNYFWRYTLSYYFSTKAWSKHTSGITRIPVRAEIEGYHSDLTAPSLDDAPTDSSSPIGESSHMVVCGRPGYCNGFASKSEPDSTQHEVRCCSDTELAPSWKQRPGCTVYGGSDEGFECQHGLTYTQAHAFCKQQGARLCTQPELEAGCTWGSGCGHDTDHVWSATPTYKFHHFYDYVGFDGAPTGAQGATLDDAFTVPQALDCHIVTSNHTLSYWLGNVALDNKPRKAVASFKAAGVGGLNGWVLAQQESPDSPTVVEVVLSGMATDPSAGYGAGAPSTEVGISQGLTYHLHDVLTTTSTAADGTETQVPIAGCAGAGGHFNPVPPTDAAAIAKGCGPDNLDGCAAGELSLRHGNLVGNQVVTAYFDTKLSLFGVGPSGEGSAVGKLLVIHRANDSVPFACAALRDFYHQKDDANTNVKAVVDATDEALPALGDGGGDGDGAAADGSDGGGGGGGGADATVALGCQISNLTVTCDQDALNSTDSTVTNGAEEATATETATVTANVTDSQSGEKVEKEVLVVRDQHGCILSSTSDEFQQLTQWCNFTTPPQCVLQGTICIDPGAASAHLAQMQSQYESLVDSARLNASLASAKLADEEKELAALQLALSDEKAKLEAAVAAAASASAGQQAAIANADGSLGAVGVAKPVSVAVAWPKGVDSACAITKCAAFVSDAISIPEVKQALDCTTSCADGWTQNCVFQCAASHNLTAPTNRSAANLQKFLSLEACVDSSGCLSHTIGWSFGVNSFCADGNCAEKQAQCLASERCRRALACAKTPDGGHWTAEQACACAAKADVASASSSWESLRTYFDTALAAANKTAMAQLGIDTSGGADADADAAMAMVQAYQAGGDNKLTQYACLDASLELTSASPSAQPTPKGLFLSVVRCLVTSGCTDEGREAMVQQLAVSESFGKGVDSRCVHRHCSAQMQAAQAPGMLRSTAALECSQDCELYNAVCAEECARQQGLDPDALAAAQGDYSTKQQQWDTEQAQRKANDPSYPGEPSPYAAELADLQLREAEAAAFAQVHSCIQTSGCLELLFQWRAGAQCMMQQCAAQQASCISANDCALAYQCAQQHCVPWTDECANNCRDSHTTSSAPQFNALAQCASTEHQCTQQQETVSFRSGPSKCGTCTAAAVGAAFAGLFLGGPFWWCAFGRGRSNKAGKFSKMQGIGGGYDDDDRGFGGGGGGGFGGQMSRVGERQQAV